MGCTLGQNCHWIVDLDVHMVAYGSKFLLLLADDFASLTLNLPGASSVLIEPAGNNNTIPIFFGFVRFVTLILNVDRHL